MTAHEALKQCRDALALAHAICDRVPARWHELSPSSFPTEHDIGRMVNWQPDGSHGYALIREALAAADAALSAAPAPDTAGSAHISWACEQWRMEVAGRPMINIHRRTLDDKWRQFIRYFGGDPEALLGPSHDTLRAAITSTEWERMNGNAPAPAQAVPLTILREMLADTREVFDANGSETPQVVRDVIEFVVSWIDVYTGKTGEQKHG